MAPSPTDDCCARRTHRWQDAHVLPGLLGPLLHDPDVVRVKGFHQPSMRDGSVESAFEAGRVTEPVARPLVVPVWARPTAAPHRTEEAR